MPEVKEEGLTLLLTVVANINSRLALLAHDRSNGLPPGTLDLGIIDRLPERT